MRVLIKIAICDDDKNAIALQEVVVKSSLQHNSIGYEITTYTIGTNLLDDITDDGYFFDLILLDIEMPELNGMQISEKLKAVLPNVKIIFVTSHTEYAIDAFELSIFRYILKSNLKKKLSSAVIDAAKLIELGTEHEYIIQTNNRMEKIPYKDIFYIQRDRGKNSIFYTSMGTSKVRKSLQQIYEELSALEFVFIDRSYIVNIIQIMKICDNSVILKNDIKLPVSRSHLQEVKQQINRFWGKQRRVRSCG